MFPSYARALAVSLAVLSAMPAAAGEALPEKVKLTARPQGATGGLALTTLDEKAAFALSQAAIGQSVGNFTLLDRQERPVELTRYRGKPLLVNFIYTACFQVCPTTTRNLQKAIQNTVSVVGADRFNVISIGFNQPFDSPGALRDFARQYGIHLPNWEFLSPSSAIVGDLTRNFGFSFVATAAGFDHLNQVTMVDAQGTIVRQVYGEKFGAEDLIEPLKRLIAGAPLPQESNALDEIIERVRIICSIYDPVTGRYRTNYALYLQAAGFVSFVIFLLYLSVHFWKNRRRSEP
ncbi:MAG TPA: SCO family protein [Accumulibacter sp.]|uniref:SCO family protein n=1 Tax=Accumulibacter sp. TaxID=2053492 RepID=UPI00287A8CC2|nr:SCO family protein [Accumulibacter sp.]MDS4053889.1 SCO family protein [Accumulibacter sp.]HMV04541.1 SCO family protein [Accumulibacter sp.]HMW63986.1 SCO family protein [Accumulibacter sp.]HMW79745.1 SCO family protein [Accumulibacter sp.]HMX68579.1 SCO family protein [Accumulibacter sp.]